MPCQVYINLANLPSVLEFVRKMVTSVSLQMTHLSKEDIFL